MQRFEIKVFIVINENNFTHEKSQIVKGVSHIEKVSLVNLEGSGMVGIPGFSKRLFECLSQKNARKFKYH